MPKYLDEVKLSLSKQLIDLIAFNETRLDPTKTNDQIKINGYDVIRKDRSRTGGGVCIYLRSTINYHTVNLSSSRQFIDHQIHLLSFLLVSKI